MILVALLEAAERGELILMQDGMCRWHLRRDGIVVIREILVSPCRQGQGIGRKMVELVKAKNPGAVLVAKCPLDYEANIFWKLLGFTEVGRTEKLIEWHLVPSSSGAPTVTPGIPRPPLPPAGATGFGCPPEAC